MEAWHQQLRTRGYSSSSLDIMRPDLPNRTAYTFKPAYPTAGLPSLLRPPIAVIRGTGILTCFPSVTPLGLTLGADSPYVDERCVGNLGFSARGILTPFIVTHVSILTSDTSSRLFNPPSTAYRTLPYPAYKYAAAASVQCLAPVHLRRKPTRPVSYYAFFKGWLLLSQPPGCFSFLTSFPT